MNGKHQAMVAAAALLAVAAWAPAASAQEQQPQVDTGPTGVLRLGKLYSFGGGAALDHGFGLDMRYQIFPARDLDGYVGLFGQGQYELGDAWRFTGGITGGWSFFGLEVGVAHRTATATYAGSTGLHIGQSFTFGPVSVGGRLTIPLVDYVPENVAMPPGVQGIEGALTVTVGFGFRVHGAARQSGHGGHHGCMTRRRHH